MPSYTYEKNGKSYTIEAPDDASMLEVAKGIPDEKEGDSLAGVGKAAATGLGRGVTITADTLKGMLPGINKSAADYRGGPPQDITTSIGNAIGGWHSPQGPIEDVVQGGFEAAPLGLLAPAAGGRGIANAGARAFTYGFVPGATGRLAHNTSEAIAPGAKLPIPNPFTGNTTEIPFSELASAVGSLAAPTGWTGKKITPFTQTSPARQAAAETVRAQTGRWPTVGQIFNNQQQKNRELKTIPNINELEDQDLTRGYTRTVGPGAESPTVSKGTGGFFDTQRARIDNEVNTLAGHVFADPRIGTGVGNTQLYTDLSDISRRAITSGNPNLIEEAKTIFRGINPQWDLAVAPKMPPANPLLSSEELHHALFRNVARGPGTAGTIPMGGSMPMNAFNYQRLRDTLHNEANNSEPVRATFFRNIADALDGSVQRTLQASGRQDLYQRWASARNQNRSLLTLEEAAKRLPAGTDVLNPDVMKAADLHVAGTRPYLRGETPYADLTEAAGRVFRNIEEKPVLRDPGVIEGMLNRFPGGRYIHGPVATLAAAGGLLGHHLGMSWHDAFSPAILGAILGEKSSPYTFSRANTVGANSLSQWYGRNQIMPQPQSNADVMQQRLQAAARSLMIPQQNQYDQQNPP